MKSKRYKILSVLIALTMFISIAVPAQTVYAAKKLSKNEKHEYTEILLGRYYDSRMDKGRFMLYDINNDNRKELIIEEFVGIRNNCHTTVYSYDRKKKAFRSDKVDGYPKAIFKKGGLEIEIDNYVGAGEIEYKYTTVYTLTSKGKLKPRITVKKVEDHRTPNGGYKEKAKVIINYWKHKTMDIYKEVNIYENKSNISKKTYNKLRSKYKTKINFQKKRHKVSPSNIKKYIK